MKVLDLNPLESVIQSQIMGLLKMQGFHPIHIPNRGLYNTKTRKYNLKDRFHRKGVPDLVVPVSYGRAWWIEVKSEKGKVSQEQKAFLTLLENLGHLTLVARSVHEVQAFLERNKLR